MPQEYNVDHPPEIAFIETDALLNEICKRAESMGRRMLHVEVDNVRGMTWRSTGATPIEMMGMADLVRMRLANLLLTANPPETGA